MVYTEADTRAKLSSLIKLSGIDKQELKEAFGSVGEIKEGYFGLQREIYK
jgi:hypothetical protein